MKETHDYQLVKSCRRPPQPPRPAHHASPVAGEDGGQPGQREPDADHGDHQVAVVLEFFERLLQLLAAHGREEGAAASQASARARPAVHPRSLPAAAGLTWWAARRAWAPRPPPSCLPGPTGCRAAGWEGPTSCESTGGWASGRRRKARAGRAAGGRVDNACLLSRLARYPAKLQGLRAAAGGLRGCTLRPACNRGGPSKDCGALHDSGQCVTCRSAGMKPPPRERVWVCCASTPSPPAAAAATAQGARRRRAAVATPSAGAAFGSGIQLTLTHAILAFATPAPRMRTERADQDVHCELDAFRP